MIQKKTKGKKAMRGVEEPKLLHGEMEYASDLHFFSSFKEMNEADHDEMATMSPEENLFQTTLLIKQVFAKELKKIFSGYTIHFM